MPPGSDRREALDIVHRMLRDISAVMAAPEASRDVRASAAGPSFNNLVRHAELSVPSSSGVVAPETTFPAVETVRISVAKLDARLVEAEEMLTAKLTATERAEDLRKLVQRFEAWRIECATVEPDARALRRAVDRPAPGRGDPLPGLSRLLEFVDWNLDHLKSIESEVAALSRAAEHDRRVVGKLVDDLLEDSKKLLLLRFETMSASFQKLVRDLCRDQGKEADLAIRGEDIEIDKRILEEMKDPLIHLLRNCVDHGIEPPGERTRAGKSSRGTITLAVTRANGNKVQLLVSDDGAGVDIRKVKESAVRRGVISAEEAAGLDEATTRALIFQSDVSVSPVVTRLSGRGLGLAIVREKAGKLGGTVSVESRPGLGTAFHIIVPATRATFRGILVEAAGRRFLVPTSQVERVARAKTDDIQTVEGRETILWGGRALALVGLADALELPSVERKDTSTAATPVVVLGSGDQRVAFAVDAVLDELEVLVKPLVKPLSRVRNVAAATVLGSGQVVPILNVADLLKSARKVGGARAGGDCSDRACAGRDQDNSRRRGFDHVANAAERHPRIGGLQCENSGRRNGGVHPAARRNVRPGCFRCGNAAAERLRPDGKDSGRQETSGTSSGAGDGAGNPGRPRARHRRRRQCVYRQEQFRSEQSA